MATTPDRTTPRLKMASNCFSRVVATQHGTPRRRLDKAMLTTTELAIDFGMAQPRTHGRYRLKSMACPAHAVPRPSVRPTSQVRFD